MPVAEYRILVVDDDPFMRSIVATALGRDATFSVVCCENGKDGLAMAAAWCPDLILCDVSMQHMNGFDVLRRLRAETASAEIPLIFVTARSDAADVNVMLQLGAAAIITKPFKLRDLIAAVRRELFMPEAGGTDIAPPAYDFVGRLRADGVSLREFHGELVRGSIAATLKDCVHRLAGASDIYGFETVSAAANAVERQINNYDADSGNLTDVNDALNQLILQVDAQTKR
ncbi:MAG: response regulator [Pseudolabrys sp.]|nr:response regulator [Pseudolabrys sp.]